MIGVDMEDVPGYEREIWSSREERGWDVDAEEASTRNFMSARARWTMGRLAVDIPLEDGRGRCPESKMR